MKGIKIVLIVFMSITLLFVVNTGFAQKLDTKETVPQQPIQKEIKLIKIIRDCYIPCINTEKLYAVVETLVVPSETQEKATETEENRGIETEQYTTQQTLEYAISPEVEIREQTDEGLQFTIETVAAVGFITKADIFIMKHEVIKIIILGMEQ